MGVGVGDGGSHSLRLQNPQSFPLVLAMLMREAKQHRSNVQINTPATRLPRYHPTPSFLRDNPRVCSERKYPRIRLVRRGPGLR